MDQRRDSGRHWLVAGVVASVALHLVIGLVMRLATPHAGPERAQPMLVDIEVAPEAPLAEDLAPEEEPAPEPEATAPVPPPPPPPPEPEPEPEPEPPADKIAEDEARDAGIDATEVAEDEARDAGIDATEVALDQGDAGVGDGGIADDDGGALALTDDGGAPAVADDGGVLVAQADDGGGILTDGGAAVARDQLDGDGGPAVATGADPTPRDGGPGDGKGGPGGAAGNPQAHPSAGTAANLLAFFPSDHVLTALLRFDRIRGTEWAAPAEAILAPMPDYGALIGDRDVRITDVFDSLVISTSNPTDIASTTLVGRSTKSAAELRALVDQPDAPVRWSVARGGALGRRGASARVFPGDPRVFLMPYPGWMVMASPDDLDGLLVAGAGTLDSAAAPTDALPPWLDRVRTIEAQAGEPTGPALMATIGKLKPRIKIPDVLGLGITGLPGPERVTVSLEVDRRGFVVRGNLRFASAAAAEEFETSVNELKAAALGSRVISGVLRRASGYNVIKNLSLKRTDQRISYGTSISIADARAGLVVVASMVERFYDARARKAAKAAGKPAPPAPPAPKGAP